MKNNLKKDSNLKIKIRKMQEKDLQVLLKIGKKQWKDENWITDEYLKSSFKNDGLKYVATFNKKVIGGIILVYEDIAKNWIRYLIVEKNFRRKGIGKLFIEKISKKIKSGESIFVDTGVKDKKTILFYEKLGFKNRGLVKSLYGNMPAYFFERTF